MEGITKISINVMIFVILMGKKKWYVLGDYIHCRYDESDIQVERVLLI